MCILQKPASQIMRRNVAAPLLPKTASYVLLVAKLWFSFFVFSISDIVGNNVKSEKYI